MNTVPILLTFDGNMSLTEGEFLPGADLSLKFLLGFFTVRVKKPRIMI